MQKMIITIGRQFCSGGSEIGRKLSERLGIPYHDKNLYEYAAKSSGLSENYVRQVEETPTSSFLYSMAMYPYTEFGADNMIPNGIVITADQSNFILEKAKEGPCIFVGRCADYILRDRQDCVNVFIHGNTPQKIERIVKLYNVSEAEAKKLIKDTDKKRAINYNYCTDRKWGRLKNYSLALNSSELGIDKCIELISAL